MPSLCDLSGLPFSFSFLSRFHVLAPSSLSLSLSLLSLSLLSLLRACVCAVASTPSVEWVLLNMPNLHFNPISPVTGKFDHDVYFPTSEPHGTIEAVVQRKPMAKM